MTQEMRDITVQKILPHAIETVWRALTTTDLIGKWLMPNDFAATPGHEFTFKARPMGDWDGIIRCRVLTVEPPRRLVYSWQGGDAANTRFGGVLDTTVTWTLEPVEAGTKLTMIHAGFKLPQNQAALDAMSHGWGHIVEGLGRVAGEIGLAL